MLAHLLALVLGAEPPPVILDVRRVVAGVRHTLAGTAPAVRQAVPAEGLQCTPPLTPPEDSIQAEAESHLSQCSRTSAQSDPWVVLRLVELEHDLGAPAGLLSSAVCWETGYRANSRGDWRHRHARAHGWYQMHEQWETVCRLSRGGRDDIDAASACYFWRVLVRAEEARECAEPLVVGEAIAANVVRYRVWGCAARSRHSQERDSWRLCANGGC